MAPELRRKLHRNQEELQTMPTQPPHHVSSLAFRISDLSRISSVLFRISPDPSGRIIHNENQIERTPKTGRLYLTPVFQPGIPPRPKNAKRTQLPRAASVSPASPYPIMQNEPCAKLSWCNSAGLILPGPRLAARPE